MSFLTSFHRRLNPPIPEQEDTGIHAASTESPPTAPCVSSAVKRLTCLFAFGRWSSCGKSVGSGNACLSYVMATIQVFLYDEEIVIFIIKTPVEKRYDCCFTGSRFP